MAVELNDDTLYTGPIPSGGRVFGALSAVDSEPTSFGKEAIVATAAAGLAAVASSGSASDLSSGTLPLGRLHAFLQDIANLSSPTQGSVFYFDGTDVTVLAPGTSGEFLKTQGAGANPTWATPAGGGGGGSGDLLSTNNLSDVADVPTARDNLGLEIGADVQAWDATLAALAGVTVAANKLIYATAADTFSTTDFTSVARTLVGQSTQALMRTTGLGLSSDGSTLVVAADYAAMRALLDLEAGTDFYSISAANAAFQPLDSDLSSWASVTRASGFDTFATTPSLANLGSLLTDEASGLITFMTTPSSANLKSLVTDETGSGALVFATSPGFTTAANPVSNDGASLGISGTAWSDLFLASGAVLNFAAGDYTITHASALLTFSTYLQIGTGGNTSNSPNALVKTARSYTGTSAGYGFADNTLLNLSAKVGFASFDARPDYTGTQNYDHFVSFQSRLLFDSTGGMDNAYGLYDAPTFGAGTTTNRYGVWIADAVGAGTLTNNYGVYIAAQTKGATLNYALYSAGTAPSIHGGSLAIGSTTTPAYKADVRGTTAVSQLHVAASNADVGGYLTATSDALVDLSGGAAFNATNWVAKATGAGIMAIGNGVVGFYTDTGLTPGNTFTPTLRADYGVTTASTWTFVGSVVGSGLLRATTTLGISTDVLLNRDAANTLALRNSISAQTFNVYNTYTDASNYERAVLQWSANICYVGTSNAGTGSRRELGIVGNEIYFYVGSGGTQVWNMKSTGHFVAQSDNTYDIGASGATRPRTGYFGTSVVTPLLTSTGLVHAYSGTAIPAGGTAGAGVRVSSTSNFGMFFGSGAPSLSAAKGSIYLRSDGSGTTDRAYINTDGGTTWTALTTVA